MARRIDLVDPRRATSSGASFRRPAFSADARRLVVEADVGAGLLYLVDTRGRIERVLGEGREATFSPDGQRLAFSRTGSDGRREIWACDLATPHSAARLAGGDGGSWEHPAFSPDGARLACASDYGNPAGIRHLWLLDAVHGDRHRATSDPQRSDGHPAFSPDGQLLAFDGDDRADDAREIDLYVLDLGSGRIVRLTDGAVPTRRPAFIDRRHLLAERRSVSGPTLVVVDREKQRTLPVGDHPDGEREPVVRLRYQPGDKKRPRILVAYTRRQSTGGQEADRDAVWVAELGGLKVTTESEAIEEAVHAAVVEAERAGLPVLGGDG